MNSRMYTMDEIEQLKILGRGAGRDLPTPDVEERAPNGALTRVACGFFELDPRPSGPHRRGVLQAPKSTGADLASLVTGESPKAAETAFADAWERDWSRILPWALSLGLRPAEGPYAGDEDPDRGFDVYPLEPNEG